MTTGTITKVAGPLVIAEGMRDANMFDVVRVSSQRLIGEIIEMHGDKASIQVYEETSGLGPGETVESTGAPLSVELGPCLLYTSIAVRNRTMDSAPTIPRERARLELMVRMTRAVTMASRTREIAKQMCIRDRLYMIQLDFAM